MTFISRLPGKAYAKRQHIWLTGANEVDSKVFSRTILAKSARVQTVLCIPLLDGVVELGTTDRVEENIELIQHVKKLFINYHQVRAAHDQTPKPALSEHSTSNPSVTNHFLSPPLIYTPADEEREEEEEEDEDGDEDQKADDQLDSEEDLNSMMSHGGASAAAAAEPSDQLMQVDMSEDIRLGSPDSNNLLDSHFHDLLLTVSKAGGGAESTTHGYPHSSTNSTTLQQPPTGAPPIEELPHYSQTVSSILQHRSIRRWSVPSSTSDTMYPSHSAFTNCTLTATRSHHLHVDPNTEGTSQWLLKYMLFTVPFLHTKSHGVSATGSPADLASGFRKATPREELSANHVLAERRRREKLNERFIILRSLVPFVTKMDKASILGDTIEYVKQLLKKIQDLEGRVRDHQRSGNAGDSERKVKADKRKMSIVEGDGGARPMKSVEFPAQTGEEVEVEVEVSIIENDGLVEMTCPCREGLLLDVMQKLREFRMEITTVQSSSNHGVFVAELRAKVKENLNGKKVSIVEVKRAIKHIIKLSSSSTLHR